MWQVEWGAISARIQALLEAGTFFFETIKAGEHDTGSAGNELIRNGKELIERLVGFQRNFANQLPEPAPKCLSNFVTASKNAVSSGAGIPTIQELLTVLASYRAEFNYIVSDNEAVARSLVARAFSHLQRSIVADAEVQKKWAVAFDSGEIACEKLGATHLLWHGIWAFKADAQGERTDLVLGVPLEITSEVRDAADALVLTEWKLLKKTGDLDAHCDQAFKQAQRYSVGILAGFELSTRRYLVVVSQDHLTMPAARQEGEVVYEYINIAVSPTTPSKKGLPPTALPQSTSS
jgi:hypothetical protein